MCPLASIHSFRHYFIPGITTAADTPPSNAPKDQNLQVESWNCPSESFTHSPPKPLTLQQGRKLQNSVETAIHNRAHNRISHLQMGELSAQPVTLQELVDPQTAQAARARQTIQLADRYLAQAHNHNNSNFIAPEPATTSTSVVEFDATGHHLAVDNVHFGPYGWNYSSLFDVTEPDGTRHVGRNEGWKTTELFISPDGRVAMFTEE